MSLALLLSGWISAAAAQESEGLLFEQAFFGVRCGISPLPGTPSLTLIREAQQTNAATYGALEFAESTLIPAARRAAGEEWDGEATVFALRVDNLFGVAHVPSLIVPGKVASDCDPSGWVSAPADLMSNRLGFARQWRYGGLFYAVSVNGYGIHANQDTRIGAPYMLFAVNSMYAFAAPFLPAETRTGQQFTLTWDWVAGARFTPGSLDLRAGYLGSEGFSADIAERNTGLFAGAAALPNGETDLSSKTLPWLLAGIERVPLPTDLTDRIGATGLLLRRVRWVAPIAQTLTSTTDTTGTTDTTAASTDDPIPSVDFYSAQIEQRGLWDDHVDIRVIGGAAPEPFLHEASITYRSDDYDTLPDSHRDAGWAATVGVITMPEAAWYGIEPGLKPLVSVAFRGENDDGSKIGGGLRLNDSATLAVHPYAVNAVSVFIDWSAAAQ